MTKKISHYYGDTVRKLFVVAALVMIVALPFFVQEIGVPIIFSLAAILALGIAAGLTSPRHPWTATMNVFVAAVGVLVFESYAADWHTRYGSDGSFFWTTQFLAVVFLLALYFSLKTLRRVGQIRVTEAIQDEDDSIFAESTDAGGDGDDE